MLPLHSFSGTVFVTVCFYLGVLVTAYTLGYLIQKRAVLHGILSVGIALLTVALSTSLFLSAIDFHILPPSDWRLIQRFEHNEAAFNELRDAVRGEEGIESYRVVMKRLGIADVSESKSPESVSFSLKRDGFLSYKGYVYRQTAPPQEQIVEKITEEVVNAKGVYRPITDGWYLYAEAISD